MVLDDPFSSIDPGVEDQIVNALLGPDGILRKMKSTVFLITHGSMSEPYHFPWFTLSDIAQLSIIPWPIRSF